MTTERFNFITRDEFNAHEYRMDHKFDDLTEIMLREFDKVHAKNDRSDARLDSIEVRLGTMSEDMREVKLFMMNTCKRFDSIDQKFDSIDQRFESVDKRFDSMDNKFALVMSELAKQNMKLDAIIAS